MAGRIAYYGNISTQGLVLDLDAAIQGSYPKTGSTWFDISNNGNNGTLTNGPLYTGSDYGAIVFDGVNDTYTLGSFRIGVDSSFTISSWFKRNGVMNNKILLKSSDGTGRIWFGVIDEANVYGTLWNNTYYTSGSSRDYWQRVSNTFTSSQFTELVFTQDKSTLIQKSYLNGSETNSTVLSGNLNNTNESFQSTEINASISNLKIYNQSLTPFQIWQNFNAYKSRYGIPDIVTDGLVLNLDAGNPYSYLSGSSGTTWTNTVAVSSSISGTLVNGTTYSNGAMVFDGVDDVVSVGVLNTINNASSLTISYWMKKSASNKDMIVGSQVSSNTNGIWLQWYLDGTIYFSPRNGSLTSVNYALSYDSNWKYLVGVYQNSSGSIYVNGSLVATGTGMPSSLSSTAGNDFTIGNLRNLFPSTGNISAVKVYNRALTQAEITQNFNALRGRYGI